MSEEASELRLNSFGQNIQAAVIGASGGLGCALARDLDGCTGVARLFRLARSPLAVKDNLQLDLNDEASIEAAANSIRQSAGELHLVIVATGLLHDGGRMQPEKSWQALTAPALERAIGINAIGPALVAKHFLPLLAKNRKTAFAAISARVGSIEDNGLGGWYAYRASKAALNMLIKTFAIELARRRPDALCVGLHPGTVDTRLSQPFQANVGPGKLFSPARSARHMLTVLERLGPEDSGGLFAWDGQRIPL